MTAIVALVAGMLMTAHGSQHASASPTPESSIAYSSGTGDGFRIWLVDPGDPGNAFPLTSAGYEDYDPVWSQDGSRLAFWRLRRSDNMASLWVVDRDGTGERMILDWTSRGGGSLAPHFWYTADPAGERVYYVKDPGGSCQFLWIYADEPASQTPHPVAGAEAKCQPDLSPDQTEVALRDYGAVRVIEVGGLSPDGNVWTKTGDIVGPGRFSSEVSLPEWSPDAGRVAFSVVGQGVWTVAQDGTDFAQVSDFGHGPTWSPDSSRLTFQANGDIYVTPSDGSGSPINITEGNALVDLSPHWSPTLNEVPTADAGGPYLVAAGNGVAFDGSGSSDPDGDALTETWVAGGGTVLGDTYTAGFYPGVYDVCLTVNDGTLDSDESCTFVVVYDATAGFATGGGWFDSPEGAYAADPSLTGRATFGFVSKYKKGATVPSGQTEFRFSAADVNFHSSSYEWLVVTGNDVARFKGVGTINGVGEYRFHVWAHDGNPDTFRIRIWEEDAAGVEADVYDNGRSQPLRGGNIKVHSEGDNGFTPVGDMPGTVIGVDDQSITLGVVADQSGPFAGIYPSVARGIDLGVQYVNERLGGVCGRAVDVVVEDHGYDLDAARQKYEALRAEVALFVDFWGSPHNLHIADDVIADGKVVIPLSRIGDWYFENNWAGVGMPYQWESYASVSWLLDHNSSITKIGVVHLTGLYGESGAFGAHQAAAAAGIESFDIVLEGPESEIDMVPVWQRAEALDADLIHMTTGVLAIVGPNGVLQAVEQTGYQPLLAIEGPAFQKQAYAAMLADPPPYFEKMYFTAFTPPTGTFQGLLDISGMTAEELFDDPDFSGSTVNAFRHVGWFYNIASRTCDNLSQEGLLASLTNLSYYNGLSGAFGSDTELFQTYEDARVQGTDQYIYQPCTSDPTGLCDISGPYSPPGMLGVSLTDVVLPPPETVP